MTALAALIWSVDEIRVSTAGAEFRLGMRMDSAERYGLRLIAAEAGTLFLCGDASTQLLWRSCDCGRTFEPLPPVPIERERLASRAFKVHRASATVTALGHRQLWTYAEGADRWGSRELPQDLQVRDVGFDEAGGLWCAGSVRSRRIPDEETEAAVRYQALVGTAFQSRSPRLSPLDAVKVVKAGGLAEFRTVDAEAERLRENLAKARIEAVSSWKPSSFRRIQRGISAPHASEKRASCA